LAVDECASVWPGCHPTGASSMVPQALPVGLHKDDRNNVGDNGSLSSMALGMDEVCVDLGSVLHEILDPDLSVLS
jgi:hypothetical protein